MASFRLARAGILTLCMTFFLTSCGGGGGGATAVTPPVVANADDWLIPRAEVVDGGPGQDGIPAIDAPQFQRAADVSSGFLFPGDLVVGVFLDGEYRAYPHKILNWHEVVNDSVATNDFVLSYCPLTGSALTWDVDDSVANPQYGVSGLLYNSNLIMYDRESDSRWSQMLEQAVWGPRQSDIATRIQLIETTWATWVAMYPDSSVLTTDTGHDRNYLLYPYGDYCRDDVLLFPVSNLDNRLHKKERVIGIRSAAASKVYQLSGFGATTQTINEQFDGQEVVIVGNSDENVAAIFSRELSDGTILTFSPLTGQLPAIMQDTEGNVWDVFGIAVSGPRTGTRLASTDSYTAMWFAWATFFDNTQVHFN